MCFPTSCSAPAQAQFNRAVALLHSFWFQAALDGFAEEPLGDSPLRALDNVICSPHAGAATLDAVRRTANRAVDQLLRDL